MGSLNSLMPQAQGAVSTPPAVGSRDTGASPNITSPAEALASVQSPVGGSAKKTLMGY